MKDSRSILLWVAAFIITIGIALYQKTTGPTYPVYGEVMIGSHEFKYKLKRTHGGKTDHEIRIEVPDPAIEGWVLWKRYKMDEPPVETQMAIDGMELVGNLPHQPPAGKLEYQVRFNYSGEIVIIPPDEAAVIRFKGAVPTWILIPHVLGMFLALFIGMRACLSAILGLPAKKNSRITLWLIIIGGLILGPLVQKFAFGAFWTGWPFGGDWTDNKTAIMALGWLAAIWMLRGEPGEKRGRWWVVAATVVMFGVYLIPHSMHGSELDYSKLPTEISSSPPPSTVLPESLIGSSTDTLPEGAVQIWK